MERTDESRGVGAIFPKAVFFDFDGVLVESTDIKTNAFRALYASHGRRVLERVIAYHAAHEGISRVEKIRYCQRAYLGQPPDAAELERLCERYSRLVEDAVVGCPWVAGGREFLESVAGRLPVFVVSGTPEDELRRIVKARRMDHLLTAVYGSPRTKDVIVNAVLAERRLAADDTVFVGDAMTDYLAAKATGTGFVGRVASGSRNPFPTGSRIVPDLRDLAAAIGFR